MDEGNIVARGKHDDLMKSCDIYKEISSSQMKGVEEHD
jgi:ABC-type multidrug transport system fused ATPase/permease subunit